MYKTIYVYRNGKFLLNISSVRSVEILNNKGTTVLVADGVPIGFMDGFRFVVETWGRGC